MLSRSPVCCRDHSETQPHQVEEEELVLVGIDLYSERFFHLLHLAVMSFQLKLSYALYINILFLAFQLLEEYGMIVLLFYPTTESITSFPSVTAMKSLVQVIEVASMYTNGDTDEGALVGGVE